MIIDTRDLKDEIDRIMDNITEDDQVIFTYLLEKTIWNFYHGTYDNRYKLPWTNLRKK